MLQLRKFISEITKMYFRIVGKFLLLSIMAENSNIVPPHHEVEWGDIRNREDTDLMRGDA